jgi:hypothetical protein
MSGATVRVRRDTHESLRELARETGEPIQDIVSAAVELYRRQRILDATNAAYAALRANAKAWNDELQERAGWEATVGDALDEN